MKKIAFLLFALLIGYPVLSQIYSGIYQIKLLTTQKALEDNYGNLAFNPSCENTAAVSCKRQVWELKSVPNRANVYTITNISNNLLLTYTKNGGPNISDVMNLLPIKPQAQREEQYFYILEKNNPDRTPAGYIIQPYSRANPNAALNYYLAARESSMRWDNCPLVMFNTKGMDTEKLPYETLLFSIEKASPGVIVATPQISNTTMNSSVVIVAPKSDNKMDIDFKTGDDNLEVKSFQENLEIRIIVQNKADIILKDANKNQSWPNNSIRRVSIPLPADITVEEIKEIHLYRKQKGGIKYVWELGEKDNWNLQSISATATILTNGVKKKYEFEKIVTTRRGSPLYRFTYDNNNSETDGTCCKRALTLIPASLPPAVNTTVPSQNASLTMTFGTGGDNLEGGSGNNVNIKITFKSSAKVISLNNINDTAKWDNFTERTVTKEAPNSTEIDINDIKEVEVRHTGGGGMFADNWHVDKIKITITKNGQSKVLVDRVGAPIHMFTGDTRSKRFAVE